METVKLLKAPLKLASRWPPFSIIELWSPTFFKVWRYSFNPLTPEPAVAVRDEPRPFLHFWSHPFWPNLASCILNLCRRKTSFQWCPDQGDWPNGARDMHKNAQKVEWKTPSKISCHYPWLLHRKNRPYRWRLLRSFLTASKPRRRSITAAKRKEKEKKERWKNNSQNFDFNACPSKNIIKRDASGKNGKLARVANAFSTRLKLIWPKSSLKLNRQNVQNVFLRKALGFNELKRFSANLNFEN